MIRDRLKGLSGETPFFRVGFGKIAKNFHKMFIYVVELRIHYATGISAKNKAKNGTAAFFGVAGVGLCTAVGGG